MDNEEDEESGEDDEDEVEDYALLEEDEPISVWSLRRIADRDATMTEEEKKKLKKTDAGIDDWIRKYLREQYERIDASVKQLVSISARCRLTHRRLNVPRSSSSSSPKRPRGCSPTTIPPRGLKRLFHSVRRSATSSSATRRAANPSTRHSPYCSLPPAPPSAPSSRHSCRRDQRGRSCSTRPLTRERRRAEL